MGNRIYNVQIGSLDLANNDTVEFFLVLGDIRVPGTSVFRTVKPGEDRREAAARALAWMLAQFG